MVAGKVDGLLDDLRAVGPATCISRKRCCRHVNNADGGQFLIAEALRNIEGNSPSHRSLHGRMDVWQELGKHLWAHAVLLHEPLLKVWGQFAPLGSLDHGKASEKHDEHS